MSSRITEPARVIIGSSETQTVSLDLTDALEAGDIPSLPVCGLINLRTNESYAAGLNGAAILTGPSPYRISQSVHALAPGLTYRLTWQWTVASTSPAKVAQLFTELFVDF